jgi:hypothetical protein
MGKSNISAWSCYECMTSDSTKITMLSQNLYRHQFNERVRSKNKLFASRAIWMRGRRRELDFLIRKRCEWFDKWRVVSKSTQQIVDLERVFARESEMQSELLGVLPHFSLTKAKTNLFSNVHSGKMNHALPALALVLKIYFQIMTFFVMRFQALRKRTRSLWKVCIIFFPR